MSSSLPLSLDTNSAGDVVVNKVDPFLKSIQALKSFLLLSTTSFSSETAAAEDSTRFLSFEELSALKRRNKSLVFQLNDALKDAVRERELRMSLEKAFDQLTSHRKQMQRHLDEALNNGGKLQQQQSLQSRILTAEAEKLEALKAAEEAKQQCLAEARIKEAAQRRTRELGDILADKELVRKVDEERNQAKLAALSDQICLLETNISKLNRQFSEIKAISEIAVQELQASQECGWEEQSKGLQGELDSYVGKMKSLQTELDASQKSLHEERQARKLVEEENTDLQEKDVALNEQLQALKHEVERLHAGLRSTGHELAETQHALNMNVTEHVVSAGDETNDDRRHGNHHGDDNYQGKGELLQDQQPEMEEEEEEEKPPWLEEETGEQPQEVEPDAEVEEEPFVEDEACLHQVEVEEEILLEEDNPPEEDHVAAAEPVMRDHTSGMIMAGGMVMSGEETITGTRALVGSDIEVLVEATPDRKRSRFPENEQEDEQEDEAVVVVESIVIDSSPEQPGSTRGAEGAVQQKRMKPSILEYEDV